MFPASLRLPVRVNKLIFARIARDRSEKSENSPVDKKDRKKGLCKKFGSL